MKTSKPLFSSSFFFDPLSLWFRSCPARETPEVVPLGTGKMVVASNEESVTNEVFSVAWGVACRDGVVDSVFWAHVRLLAERCRTDDDWQSLLGVLLQISLSDQPPPYDREPIYRWGISRAPSTGLRASRRLRRKADGAAATDRQRVAAGDRKAKRKRLREVLDGAPEVEAGEQAALARWVLEDAEFIEARAAEERELLAAEMMVAMRRLAAAARACKAEADMLRAEAAKGAAPEVPEMEEGVEEDVLRAGKEGSAATSALKDGAGADDGAAEEADAAARPAAAPAQKKLEPKEAQRKRIVEAKERGDVAALSELLKSDYEECAITAALAISDLCARDRDLQEALAACGGLVGIVALLDGDYSPKSIHDVTLCLKVLTANRMHHPQLLSQFVQAQGPRRLVRLLSSASSEPELVASALQIVRSLADVKGPRRALVGEAVLPSLLRNIRPSMPPSAVEPAAAAIAVLAKHEPPLCKGLVDANGVPALVKLLERGGGSLAAHSAASALASVASDDEVGGEAKRLAREAYAVEALLPLLDGVLSGDGSQASTAAGAASALAELCRGSSANAAALRSLGALDSVVGLLRSPASPPLLKAAACDAIGAAAASDLASTAELRRLGAVGLLAKLVRGGTKQVAASAQAVLSLLTQRGDETLASEVDAAMAEADDAAPQLVAQLSAGNKPARRAAFLLGRLARSSAAAREQIVGLGAVQALVKMMRKGAADMGTMNAVGCLEILSHDDPGVQDEAREHAVFKALVPLVRPHAGGVATAATADADVAQTGEGGEEDEENEEDAVASPASRARLSGAAPPNPEELRTEATLCLCALTAGNPISQAAAKKAGALEAVATLFDQSAEWEGAYLGAMAMQALGLSDPKAQEKAIAVAAGAGLEARTGTLKAVWAMKAEPERWASG